MVTEIVLSRAYVILARYWYSFTDIETQSCTMNHLKPILHQFSDFKIAFNAYGHDIKYISKKILVE